MQVAEAHDLQVRRLRSRELNGEIRLHPQHVRGGHPAAQIDAQVGMGLLELDEPGHQPSRADPFRHRDPHLALDAARQGVPGAQHVEGRRLHLLGRRHDALALLGELDAHHPAREQGHPERGLQLVDPLSQRVEADPQAVRGRAEAARALKLQKHPERMPVGHHRVPVARQVLRIRNTLFRAGEHTDHPLHAI